MIKISEIVLGSDTASFDFTSIPSTYSHLVLVLTIRMTESVTDDLIRLRFNNDSGANYDTRGGNTSGSSTGTSSGYESIGATSSAPGDTAAATAPADVADVVIITIPSYARTTFHKSATAQGSTKAAASSGNLFETRSATFWRSTAAIDQITVLPTTGNFKTGSVATLYGLS